MLLNFNSYQMKIMILTKNYLKLNLIYGDVMNAEKNY